MKSKINKLFVYVFLITFSILGALVVSEIILSFYEVYAVPSMIDPKTRRVFMCYEPDAKIIYDTIPNNTWPCEPVDGRGFRIHPDSPDTTNSVVIIGDSFAYGNYVDSDKTIPAYIQKKLNENNINLEVINAGVVGYGTDQSYIKLIEKVLPHTRPQLVIWLVHENDWDPYDNNCLVKIENNQMIKIPGWKNTTYIFARLYPLLPNFFIESRIFRVIKNKIPENYTFGCVLEHPISIEEQNIKKQLIFENLQELSDQAGFDLVFAYVQSQLAYADKKTKEYDEETKNKLAVFKNTGTDVVVLSDKIISELLSEEVLSSYNIDKEKLDRDLFAQHDPAEYGGKHMNYIGNKLGAEALYNSIWDKMDE